MVDWATRNGNADDDAKRVGLFTYLLLKRLDDIAYGLGLWTGVVRERHLRRAQAADPDLKPALHSRCADRRCRQCGLLFSQNGFPRSDGAG